MNKKIKNQESGEKIENSLNLAGVGYTALASFLWGILPLYWKLCSSVPSIIILGHRIFWSFLLLIAIAGIQKSNKIFLVLKDRRLFSVLFISGLLLGINWFTYIAAVNSGNIVEASMGYYINPLFNAFLGIIFLRERLSLAQTISLILAGIGVLYLSISYGKIPYVSLILMITFGFYSLLKKTTKLDSLTSLTVETMILAPLAAGFLVLQGITGAPVFGNRSPLVILAILFSGLITSLPLFCFSEGAKRIPLSSVAFIQYLSPTFMLLIGIVVYREPFTPSHLVSFACIWSALGIASYSMIKQGRRKKVR